ncbi:UNVERIFIED_CONTAM: hypothetical protein FKN15_019860 [Acipenser sinensis]
MGIPSVKREVHSYLTDTLNSLMSELTVAEKEDCVIVVFIAEVSRSNTEDMRTLTLAAQAVSIVMGIPSVKREVHSYLTDTLNSLMSELTVAEKEDCVIVVFIAEVSRSNTEDMRTLTLAAQAGTRQDNHQLNIII